MAIQACSDRSVTVTVLVLATIRRSLAVWVALALLGLPGSVSAQPGTVDLGALLSSCPQSDPTYALVRADVEIRRSGHLVGDLPCDSSETTATPEGHLLQALRLMYHMERGRTVAIPWASGSLYEWFVSVVEGIDIVDSGPPHCCRDYGGKRFIVIPTNLLHAAGDVGSVWAALAGTIGVFAHEARHPAHVGHVMCTDGRGENCDSVYDESDVTPYGTQYWLARAWLTGEIYLGVGCLGGQVQVVSQALLAMAAGSASRFVTTAPPDVAAPPRIGGGCAPTPVTDADGDLMDDDWERRFGLSPESASGADGPLGDPDGDGQVNYLEYARQTHPTGRYKRYLAEGATSSFFRTQLALFNPLDREARATIDFLPATGQVVSREMVLRPHGRVTLDATEVFGTTATEFSTSLESDAPIVLDRQMSWDQTAFGSHAETAVYAPSTRWYLAEGSTTAFDLFYLLQNPNGIAADVEVRFLRPAPAAPVVRTVRVPGYSRRTIWVNTIPEISRSDVSAVIDAVNGVPIIVERSMYLDSPMRRFEAGHASAGVVESASRWALAEGATGAYFDLFVLLANPSTSPATANVTYLLPTGERIFRSYVVPGQSRYSIWVDQEDPRLADTAVSTTVETENGAPIIVERAMWWPGPDSRSWREAHNSSGALSSGTKWAIAEGEVGAASTYLLVANTSAKVADVVATAYPESGDPRPFRFALPPFSRFNVDARAHLSLPHGTRFGAIVESIGDDPARIAVERAMYSDSGLETWAAGSNAVATRLEPAVTAVYAQDASDPLLLRATDLTGQTIDYIGSTSAGRHRVDRVRVRGNGQDLTFRYDSDGQFTGLLTRDGFSLRRREDSNGASYIEAMGPHGDTLAAPLQAQLTPPAVRAALASTATEVAFVDVNVRSCFAPVADADVSMRVSQNQATGPVVLGTVDGLERGPGEYRLNLPTAAGPIFSPCGVADWVDATCRGVGSISQYCIPLEKASRPLPTWLRPVEVLCGALGTVDKVCLSGSALAAHLTSEDCAASLPPKNRSVSPTQTLNLDVSVRTDGRPMVLRQSRTDVLPVGTQAPFNFEAHSLCTYSGSFSTPVQGLDCFNHPVSGVTAVGEVRAHIVPTTSAASLTVALQYQRSGQEYNPVFITLPFDSGTTIQAERFGSNSCSCVTAAPTSVLVDATRSAAGISGTVTVSPNFFCGYPGVTIPFTAPLRP